MVTKRFDFVGADGQRLSGQLDLPYGQPNAYAIFAHCFSCTKRSRAAVGVSRALASNGIAVLRFDFTGLGESEGDFSASGFSGNVQDLIAAYESMKGRGMEPAMLVGHSLGGAAVLAAASALQNIVAVAAISAPFEAAHVTRLLGTGLEEIERNGEAQINLGGTPFFIRRSFVHDLRSQDSKSKISALNRALLVLHSPVDQIVDISNALSIFSAALHPKSFISLDQADHLLTKHADADYVAAVIAAWASRYLGTPKVDKPVERSDAVVATETRAGMFQLDVRVAGAHFLADEPKEAGGLGSGPGPYQLLSSGLAACTAMTLRLYADRKQWPLDRVSVKVDHAKRSDALDAFTRDILVEGKLDEIQRARLVEIANKCPVHRTLERHSIVETFLGSPKGTTVVTSVPSQHFKDMEEACKEHD
jgi:putative redox protein